MPEISASDLGEWATEMTEHCAKLRKERDEAVQRHQSCADDRHAMSRLLAKVKAEKEMLKSFLEKSDTERYELLEDVKRLEAENDSLDRRVRHWEQEYNLQCELINRLKDEAGYGLIKVPETLAGKLVEAARAKPDPSCDVLRAPEPDAEVKRLEAEIYKLKTENAGLVTDLRAAISNSEYIREHIERAFCFSAFEKNRKILARRVDEKEGE